MAWLFLTFAAGLVLFGWLWQRSRQPSQQRDALAATKFNYSAIPLGYYHHMLEAGNPIRRAWHLQKFKRVIACLPAGHDLSLLDIGCFAGSFLSLVSEERFTRQLGVDILANQIDFAMAHFGTPCRRFQHIPSLDALALRGEKFHCVTLIEVIEHLEAREVTLVLEKAADLLYEGGTLIITTPNYTSAWPLLEILINKLSEVSYEEQHITKFNYFNVLSKMRRICPQLFTEFTVEFKTTTHFIAPFLAQISLDLSNRLSGCINPATWHFFPFGNLLLLSFRKRRTSHGVAAETIRIAKS